MGCTPAAIRYVDRQCIACYCGGVQDISIGSELIGITANDDVSRTWLPICFTINSSGIIGLCYDFVELSLTSYREKDQQTQSKSDNVFQRSHIVNTQRKSRTWLAPIGTD